MGNQMAKQYEFEMYGQPSLYTGKELDENLDNYSDMGRCSNPLNMDWMLIF